jgi:hypothetical protein
VNICGCARYLVRDETKPCCSPPFHGVSWAPWCTVEPRSCKPDDGCVRIRVHITPRGRGSPRVHRRSPVRTGGIIIRVSGFDSLLRHPGIRSFTGKRLHSHRRVAPAAVSNEPLRTTTALTFLSTFLSASLRPPARSSPTTSVRARRAMGVRRPDRVEVQRALLRGVGHVSWWVGAVGRIWTSVLPTNRWASKTARGNAPGPQ